MILTVILTVTCYTAFVINLEEQWIVITAPGTGWIGVNLFSGMDVICICCIFLFIIILSVGNGPVHNFQANSYNEY